MKKPIRKKEPVYRYQRAMLIDDNEIDNFINQKIIESSLFAKNVYVNSNGLSALEFLKNIQASKDIVDDIMPDIIFIDINMPLMDGFQFTDELLKLTKGMQKKPKLVILTTSINVEDKIRTAKYGAKIEYISKPLTEEALTSIK
jgi:CheY-like chemotaxis protein